MTASATALAARASWRLLHPSERHRFLDGPPAPPLPRLYYETVDGWRAPIFVREPWAADVGTPVLLLHSLLLDSGAYRYGSSPTLVDALARAGFRVYVFHHRGDREALPPKDARAAGFDDLVRRDLRAAVERIRAHSGCDKLHWVGHGFGGQLAVAWSAVMGGDAVATLTTLSAPVRFASPPTEVRAAASLARWLPARYRIPSAALARLATPALGCDDLAYTRRACPSVVRGALAYHVNDLPVALVSVVRRWLDAGVLTDSTGTVEYLEALKDVRSPLLVVSGDGDELCPPAMAEALVGAWGSPDTTVIRLPERFGHLDLVLGDAAGEAVFPLMVRWLVSRATAAWRSAA